MYIYISGRRSAEALRSSQGFPPEWKKVSASVKTKSIEQSHPTPYTLPPAPCTLHPTPHTLHPTSFILHPTPYTLHPTPYTLHPTLYTVHPTP